MSEPKTEPNITELAEEWLAYITKYEDKDKNSEIKIIVPIETVDELPVIVEIAFLKCDSGKNTKRVELRIISNKKNNMNSYDNRLHLYTSGIFCNCEEEGKNWTISMLERSISIIVSRLNNLKFNCYGSSFDYIGYTNMALLKNIFKGSNITHLDQECCVCHDDTMCKTKCDHNLCLRCWSKLKVEKMCEGCGDDDCECVNQITEGHLCPVCRSFMKLNIY